MKRLEKTIRFFLQPIERARGLRRDDSAQALLLSGFMVFLLVVFMLFAVNTSQSVYRRIRNQNAADAAADAAALWQARGINMLQSLVNQHYMFDAAMYLPMIMICFHCLKTWSPCTCCASVVCLAANWSACSDCTREFRMCDKCEKYDNKQEDMANEIYRAENAAIRLASRQIFIEANRYAKLNGASPYYQAAMTYTNFAAYKDVKDLFPIHGFLKDSFRTQVTSFNPQLMYEKFRGSANIPGEVVGEPLHAVLVWGRSYDVPWEQMLLSGTGYGSGKPGLLGYSIVTHSDNSFTDFPWVLPKTIMELISTPWLFIGGTRSDGWNDHYWENAGTPTMTWMTAVSNQVGGILRFGKVNTTAKYAGEMFWYLSPQPNAEISLAPLMAAASSTSEGKIDATDIFKMLKSLGGALKSKDLSSIDGAGRSQAKGTLVPTEITGPWWGGKTAQDMGILH